MDRRMLGKHHPLAAGPVHSATRAPGRVRAEARTPWRPDLALCVAIVGLVVGLLLLIPLLRAVAPGPPSVFAAPTEQSPTLTAGAPPAHAPDANATYRSGAGVVARGVAYAPLTVSSATSLTLPGSATVHHGHFVIVKLLVTGVSARPTTASVGLVDLVDGGVDHRPLLHVATSLAHTRWQTLVLKALTAGQSKRVKLVFALPPGAPTNLQLLIGSHTAGAPRFTVPVGPAG